MVLSSEHLPVGTDTVQTLAERIMLDLAKCVSGIMKCPY